MTELRREPDRSSVVPLVRYDKLPEGFPVNIGVCYYNGDWAGLFKGTVSSDDEMIQRFFIYLISALKSPQELPKDSGAWKSYLEEWGLTQENHERFKTMTRKAIGGVVPTPEDLEILQDSFKVRAFLDDNGKPIITTEMVNNKAILFQWVYYVWRGLINVRCCMASGCNAIYLPMRSDQKYCRPQCAKREWARRQS